MINGLAAAVFLGMAIIFLGLAVNTGMALAWVFTAINGLLFALNLMVYMSQEKRKDTNQ